MHSIDSTHLTKANSTFYHHDARIGRPATHRWWLRVPSMGLSRRSRINSRCYSSGKLQRGPRAANNKVIYNRALVHQQEIFPNIRTNSAWSLVYLLPGWQNVSHEYPEQDRFALALLRTRGLGPLKKSIHQSGSGEVEILLHQLISSGKTYLSSSRTWWVSGSVTA